MSTLDPFENALAAAVSTDRGDNLNALLAAALGIELPEEEKTPNAGAPIALNDDAALARIAGGNLIN